MAGPVSLRNRTKSSIGNLHESGEAVSFGKNGNEEEKPTLILPGGNVRIIDCATSAFPHLAKARKYFVRDRTIVELVNSSNGHKLIELEVAAFRSRLEQYFDLYKWVAVREERALKRALCSADTALALLKTKEAIETLPTIRIVIQSPIFKEVDGEIHVLGKGFHAVDGGIFVLQNRNIKEIPVTDAVKGLSDLLNDFNFVSESDRSRAAASFISPALRFGGLINRDFPLDIAEANESQSGKSYRQKLVACLYGERPFVINKKEDGSGVGSLDEHVSEGLISGRPFLMFENIRGHVASQLLESAIRGEGSVNARRAYSRGIQIETDRVYWMMSSNKADTTIDLANRSIITRIRKQPPSFAFKPYPEGDLLDHVRKNCDHYFCCVLSIVKAWHEAGKPRTNESRHDFREWAQSLDWIIQNIFRLSPLLDGHQSEQNRISNPDLGWLRSVALGVEKDKRLEEGLKPAEIADLCENHGIDIPGIRGDCDSQKIILQTGRVLKRLFANSGDLQVGGFQVVRTTETEYSMERQANLKQHLHRFEKSAT
jgi:hypothetical protein